MVKRVEESVKSECPLVMREIRNFIPLPVRIRLYLKRKK